MKPTKTTILLHSIQIFEKPSLILIESVKYTYMLSSWLLIQNNLFSSVFQKHIKDHQNTRKLFQLIFYFKRT